MSMTPAQRGGGIKTTLYVKTPADIGSTVTSVAAHTQTDNISLPLYTPAGFTPISVDFIRTNEPLLEINQRGYNSDNSAFIVKLLNRTDSALSLSSWGYKVVYARTYMVEQ